MSTDYITHRPFIWATKAKRQMIKCVFRISPDMDYRPTVFCTCATLARLQKMVTGNVPVQKSYMNYKRVKFNNSDAIITTYLFFLSGTVKMLPFV